MMPSAHAKLGPSSSSRWLTCPGSIRLAEKVPPGPDSPYAKEGTLAHSLGEIKAAHAYGLSTDAVYTEAMEDWLAEFHAEYGHDDERLWEMRTHCNDYVKLIGEALAKVPGSRLLLEQRVDTGVPKCWGTSDVVIYSPTHVHIIDLKYGAGVVVDATENPQLMLYGVGALDTFGDLLGDTEYVEMTIFQPRANSGEPSTYTLSAANLRHWRDTVAAPAARLALSDDAPLNPSDKACRWCPAAGMCKARMDKALQEDFGSDPDLITPEELAELLPKLPGIKSWCSAVEKSALDRAYSQGETIPGHKVVMSGGKRVITDDAAAIQHLIDLGFKAEQVANFKAKGIGDLEKLLGKKQFPEVMADYVTKTTGSPALVADTDKREAINPASQAAEDFA